MSKADDRRRAQADLLKPDPTNERPVEPAPQYAPDPRAWESRCHGWRWGVHEQTKENRLAGIWKCRWCGQMLNPRQPKGPMPDVDKA